MQYAIAFWPNQQAKYMNFSLPFIQTIHAASHQLIIRVGVMQANQTKDQKKPASEQEFQSFISLIKSNSLDEVKTFIAQHSGDFINRLDNTYSQPPLYFAIQIPTDEDSLAMIRTLFEAGADIGYKDSNQQSILFYSCREGKLKCIEFLLENGASLDETDVHGQTPIFYAVSENRLNILHIFEQKDFINHADSLAAQTPLYYAAKKGHLEMCKMLLQKGANIAHVDAQKKTVVDHAKRAKETEVADFLAAELKKYRQFNKMQQSSQKINESSRNEPKKKSIPRSTYKIVFMDEKGETHDLTEEEVRKLVQGKTDLEKYLANPDLIPAGKIDAQTWETVANKIMSVCWKLKGACWFHEPVDPVRYNIMDYFDIISKPMDLGTIKKKLKYNVYSSPQEFVDDMNLIWSNCYRYNGETHEISKHVKQLQKAFQECCKRYNLGQFLQ